MVDIAASCVGRPGWQTYGVWEGERIVAVGGLFVNGDCADMFGGATLPDSRGRGAQSALLTIRARAALAAGCRWLVAETGAEGSGGHNSSLHNMRRAGFAPMYDRVTWLWHK
jgi:GNAT superfamily N-acetyltransferase